MNSLRICKRFNWARSAQKGGKVIRKKEELHQLLINSNVPKDLYSLKGGFPNEAFCLNQEDSMWEVYYSGGGIQIELPLPVNMLEDLGLLVKVK